MKTIKTVMAELTDTKLLMEQLRQTLREIDPAYPEEEEKFLRAAEALKKASPAAEEYLAAREKELACGIIYAGWLGFQLNGDCFASPVNKLLLKGDHEELCRESRMHTLPGVQEALAVIRAFHVPEEQQDAVEEIIGYYAYLKTVAYKLAHHFGFCLADEFLRCVIPGYTNDPALTAQYTATLRDAFRF